MTNTAENRASPSALQAVARIARMYFLVGLGRRRTLWLSLLALLPALAALIERAIGEGGDAAWFSATAVPLYLEFLTLGLALYLGVSSLSDEIEDGTIAFLLCRPVPRGAIAVAKIAAVVAAGGIGLSASLGLTFVLCHMPDVEALAGAAPRLARVLSVLWLEMLLYTSLFSLAGVWLRRPLLLSIIFGFGWEATVSHLPGELPRFSLMFYLRSLLGLAPGDSGLLSALVPPLPPAGVATSLAVILAGTVLFAGWAAWGVGRREYR
jgi:ABC-2 type transport system permease protein